jgi:hypothetical protein
VVKTDKQSKGRGGGRGGGGGGGAMRGRGGGNRGARAAPYQVLAAQLGPSCLPSQCVSLSLCHTSDPWRVRSLLQRPVARGGFGGGGFRGGGGYRGGGGAAFAFAGVCVCCAPCAPFAP